MKHSAYENHIITLQAPIKVRRTGIVGGEV